jgi:5,10-methylenetetrahydrofolate reductase
MLHPAHNGDEEYEFVSSKRQWEKLRQQDQESPCPAPRISFEFFPPQSLDASFRLWETVRTLAPLAPNFVSVTYGAGGTTRDLTHDAVAAIHSHYGLNVAAHLTCVNATREETLAIAAATPRPA